MITNLQMDLRLNLYGCPAQHQTLAFFVLRHSNTALAASLGWAGVGWERNLFLFGFNFRSVSVALGWAGLGCVW